MQNATIMFSFQMTSYAEYETNSDTRTFIVKEFNKG